MRDVHVRPADEVAVGDLDEAEGLEVRNASRTEVVCEGRGEAEEELRVLGNQLRGRDSGRQCHLARQPAPREPLANRRALQDPRVAEQDLLGVRDVVEAVAAQQHDRIVILEHCVVRVARKANCIEQRRTLRPPVQRLQPLPLRRDETPEVRKPPAHRHADAGGGDGVRLLERRKRPFEGERCVSGVGRVDGDARRDELVMERGHEHLHAVVLLDRDAVEQVLLASRRRRCLWAARSVRQALDEPVEASHAGDGPGSADDDAPSRGLHERGRTSTSRSSMCCRFSSTCA